MSLALLDSIFKMCTDVGASLDQHLGGKHDHLQGKSSSQGIIMVL